MCVSHVSCTENVKIYTLASFQSGRDVAGPGCNNFNLGSSYSEAVFLRTKTWNSLSCHDLYFSWLTYCMMHQLTSFQPARQNKNNCAGRRGINRPLSYLPVVKNNNKKTKKQTKRNEIKRVRVYKCVYTTVDVIYIFSLE